MTEILTVKSYELKPGCILVINSTNPDIHLADNQIRRICQELEQFLGYRVPVLANIEIAVLQDLAAVDGRIRLETIPPRR